MWDLLLVLLYLSYVNLFKELFLLSPSEPILNLVLLEQWLLLESGCKGMTFFDTAKTIQGKSGVFAMFLTDVYNRKTKLWAYTL